MMHYLTQIFLDAKALWEHNIRDDYSIHRFVYSCFPLENDEPTGRFLYVDKGATRGGRILLVLSEKEPSLPEGISSSTSILSEHFLSFARYAFEVELNPVKRDKNSGKRQAVIGQLNLLKWFLDHTEKWGFTVDTDSLSVHSQATRRFQKGDEKYTFNRALFRGKLTVINRELFSQTFFQGIGHGKGFGFGLLQLCPIQNFK